MGDHTPKLMELCRRGCMAPLEGLFPALTLPAQATLLTGMSPSGHGIVGNGWYIREIGETRFWLQSNRLIQAETLYQAARNLAATRRQSFTCAKLFWWFNQGAPVEYSVTPKPFYGADGSKVFAIDGYPKSLPLRLEKALGPFPFYSFWGPMAGLASSDWIARASAWVMRNHRPTLTLVYLPHLDYDLQRFGPAHPGLAQNLRDVDQAAGLILEAAADIGGRVVVVSDYGLTPVAQPIFLNQVLRRRGWLVVRDGPFGETLDTFQSQAFAVADHQIAHVYVRDQAMFGEVRSALEATPGVAQVLEGDALKAAGLQHPRSGDLVAIAEKESWFAYAYWLDQRRAPDFARTVDIHRKPGYDPCELFFNSDLFMPKLRVAARLFQKTLGMRYLMDVIPLEASMVKGSHGLLPGDPQYGPIIIGEGPQAEFPRHAHQVKEYILRLLAGD